MKAHAARNGAQFRIMEFTNPSGATVYRVAGWKDGKRIRENYPTHGEALTRQQELEIQAANVETAARPVVTRLSPEQVADAERAFAELPDGRTLPFAVRWFAKNYLNPLVLKPLGKALEEFLEAKRKENNRPDTITNLRVRCSRLVARHPGQNVSDITTEHVKEVIFHPGISSTTSDNNRRALLSFFNWCQRQGYTAANPMEKVDPIKKDRDEPEILTLGEARRIMEAARQHKDGNLVPYFTLALFAGIRPTELARLTWDEIDLEAGAVTIGAKLAKMRQRRIVTLSKNAVAWLLPHAAQRTPIRGTNWRRDFDSIKHTAGFGTPTEDEPSLKPFVPDVLRHTAISHHYAKHANEGLSASWAGNSPDVLHRHYRGLVKVKDAKRFWSIRPEHGEGKIVRLAAAG